LFLRQCLSFVGTIQKTRAAPGRYYITGSVKLKYRAFPSIKGRAYFIPTFRTPKPPVSKIFAAAYPLSEGLANFSSLWPTNTKEKTNQKLSQHFSKSRSKNKEDRTKLQLRESISIHRQAPLIKPRHARRKYPLVRGGFSITKKYIGCGRCAPLLLAFENSVSKMAAVRLLFLA